MNCGKRVGIVGIRASGFEKLPGKKDSGDEKKDRKGETLLRSMLAVG